MPFSISTFRCVSLPSSSTLSEPRRPPMVPSSTTVQSGLATCWPIRPQNAETPLRLKSASSPCPTASCSSTPGQPGPSTTICSPAGASTASSCTIACRAASLAKCSGVRSVLKPIEFMPSAAARMTLLRRAAVVARQRADAQARQRLAVEIKHAIAGRDHHMLQDCRRTWPAPGRCADRRRAPLCRRAAPEPRAL